MAFDAKFARALRLPFLAVLSAGFAALAAAPVSDYAVRLSEDLVLPLAAAFQGAGDGEDADVALILIDETTHNTEPFREIPDVAWTPYIAGVIESVDDAGPKVMGLDMIFPKTLSTRDLLPGFDREFLAAIAKSARANRLVLSEVRLSELAIAPYRGQVLAAGAENIRSVQVIPDTDSVIRRHPARFAREDGTTTPSFASELAARAGADAAAREEPFLIDFLTPVDSIPAYRLVDLYRCREAGRADVFEAFRDKVVLIGTGLDVEDRFVPANRFVSNKQPQIRNLDCGVAAPQTAAPARATVPGVLIEALAVNTLIEDSAPAILSRNARFIASAAIFLTLGWMFFRLQPIVGIGVFIGAAALFWLGATLALAAGAVAPILHWTVGGAAMFAIVYSYRTFLEDQEKRWIRHAFQHYLSPTLVDQLADDPERLRLGGERRRAAIVFVDMAGFTSLTSALVDRPQLLTAKLNAFLSAIADAIDAHQGYVDKFIGDAVMGVWGAPIDTGDIEASAARATLACHRAVDKLNIDAKDAGRFGMRAGLSAGDIFAGNMGSRHRFNYTVVGDAVNKAARLEPLNKEYGTQILADNAFASALGDEFVLRAVDRVLLRGRSKASSIHEIVGLRAELPAAKIAAAEEFSRAVELFRNRQFEAAAAEFARWKDADRLAALYFNRASEFAADPPADDWNGSLSNAQI